MRPAGRVGEEVVAHLLVGALVVGDGAGDGLVEVGDSLNCLAELTFACARGPRRRAGSAAGHRGTTASGLSEVLGAEQVIERSSTCGRRPSSDRASPQVLAEAVQQYGGRRCHAPRRRFRVSACSLPRRAPWRAAPHHARVEVQEAAISPSGWRRSGFVLPGDLEAALLGIRTIVGLQLSLPEGRTHPATCAYLSWDGPTYSALAHYIPESAPRGCTRMRSHARAKRLTVQSIAQLVATSNGIQTASRSRNPPIRA